MYLGDKPGLSTEGWEIRKMISRGPRERVAHTASFDATNFGNHKEKLTGKSKSFISNCVGAISFLYGSCSLQVISHWLVL